jgi:hypothetical protein
MNLSAVELTDDWADRELVLVARDLAGLSATSRLMLDHLRRSPSGIAAAGSA